HVGHLSHIAPHRQGDVIAAQLFGRDLGRLEVHVTEHNPRTFGDESLRNGEAQTLRTTCNDCRLTAQQRHLDHASLGLLPSWGTPSIEYHISYRIVPRAGFPT